LLSQVFLGKFSFDEKWPNAGLSRNPPFIDIQRFQVDQLVSEQPA